MKPRRPWSPDPAWADPLILALALLCLLGSALVVGHRGAPRAAANGPSMQGRALEVALGARLAFGAGGKGKIQVEDLPGAADRAVAAVLLAEDGRVEEARALIAGSPRPSEAFLQTFEAAYGQSGIRGIEAPALQTELGDGLANRLLLARLAPAPAREAARKAAMAGWMQRFAVLAGAGLFALLLILAGAGAGFWLLFGLQRWPAGPVWEMSGRALLLVLLGWFTAYFLSAVVVQSLAALWTPLRPYALPLSYAAHAGVGVMLIAFAEGLDFRNLLRRLFPGPAWKSLALAPAFTGLGLCAALVAGLLLAPWVRGKAHPQQDLFENLRQIRGIGPVAAMFFTVAVVAPCFEEALMRGLLLGWLRSRRGATVALALSATVFGAIHLQALAWPALSLLGAAFGMGVLRTGDLRTAILAHGIWNGSLFVLMKLWM